MAPVGRKTTPATAAWKANHGRTLAEIAKLLDNEVPSN
jgi:hypothetical protein